MPFCPKCRADYREGFIVCADCGVDLVNELPPLPELPKRSKQETEPLVLIATAPNEPLANMWADILLQQNIHVLVKKMPITPAYQLFAANTPQQIYVLASDADRAKEILTPFTENGENGQ